jgi:hypothetical protein
MLRGRYIVLSDDVRARSSNRARRLIKDKSFAAKLFSASVRKLRRANGR